MLGIRCSMAVGYSALSRIRRGRFAFVRYGACAVPAQRIVVRLTFIVMENRTADNWSDDM